MNIRHREKKVNKSMKNIKQKGRISNTTKNLLEKELLEAKDFTREPLLSDFLENKFKEAPLPAEHLSRRVIQVKLY